MMEDAGSRARAATGEAAYEAGLASYRAGDYAEAAAVFAAAVAAEPSAATPLRLLGLCRWRLGTPQDAIPLLRRAHALAPDDPWTALHLGIGLQAMGQHADAVRLFQSCLPGLRHDPAPWLNLSTSLLALGDVAGALHAAGKARLRAPRMGEAHYAVGRAYLAAREWPAAAAAFTACVQHAPRLADGWVNLAVALYHQDRIEPAKRALRSALHADPDHRAAVTDLAALLLLTGGHDEAEHRLRSHLAAHPEATEVRANLAAMLLQEERADEALAVLQAAAAYPVSPALRPHWDAQLALAWLQLGRTEQARPLVAASADAPAPLRPVWLWREVLLAVADRDLPQARAKAEEMAASLAAQGPAMVPEHRILAHYHLGKFWSAQGVVDRTMAHWHGGHAELRRLQPFSRCDWHALFDANIRAFSRSRLRDGARAGNADPSPVFIVGMPRSGTTLAEQIIAAHPRAFGAGERHALQPMFARLGGDPHHAATAGRVAARDAATLDRAAADYLDALHALAPAADRVIDKLPGNFLYLGLVGLMLPRARIIHCVRDPRDVGLSIYTFRFHGYHPYAHDLGDLGWFIRQHDRLMAHWRAALPNPILTLPLTDWIDDFPGTLARVLDFLDLPYDPACERFYERQDRVRTASRDQVRQPINARGVGRWRPYAAHLGPLLAALEQDDADAAMGAAP